jgi:hypothetical protein
MKRTSIGLLIGLFWAGAAFAQLQADADGDGAVSLAELQAFRAEATAERFAALDADGDGLLTPEEMRADRGARAGRGRERLAAIDTDGDGAWSLAELQAVRPQIDVEQFNRLDANGDGLIGADERPMHGGRFGRPGPRQL